MLSIADLKIAVIGLDYVLSVLGKNGWEKLIYSKLDRTFFKFSINKNISNT